MPRVLRVDDDVVAIPQSGGSKLSIVPANTILRMKRKTVCPKNNCVYVKFTDGDNVYTFKEDARVNFTAITDPKLYNLTDYVVLRDRSSMVEFETAPDKEVVHFGISESSKAAVISGGPIEVIGSVTRDVIVGWARDKQMRSYKTVLIPDTAWNLVSIQERVFSDDFEQEIFIKKKFEHIPDSNFITNSLYIMNIQQNEPVWLISPKLFKFQPTSCSLKAPIPIPFKGNDIWKLYSIASKYVQINLFFDLVNVDRVTEICIVSALFVANTLHHFHGRQVPYTPYPLRLLK